MKMHGPVTLRADVLATDGDRFAEIGYDLPPGKFPSAQNLQEAIAKCLAEIRLQMGAEWRLATKQEFQNHVIAERFGIDEDFAVSGSDEWDQS